MSKIRKTLWISREIETKLREMAFYANIFQSVIAEEAIEELYKKNHREENAQKKATMLTKQGGKKINEAKNRS